MAFELPDHLPRGGLPRDKPTQLLSKIGLTTYTTLNASLATSWLNELDSSIQTTKIRISQRIYDDILAFERQLQSSTSIQTRLSELSTTMDALTDSLNNPNTGILSTLLKTLTAHESLSAKAQDSEIINNVSGHLLRIGRNLYELSEQLDQGQLPEAAETCERLQRLITDAPEPFNRADIMSGIHKRYRTLSNQLQEQLNDAYARSICFSSSDNAITLTILSSVIVPPTSTVISLSAILHSLTLDSLSTSLSAFRRNIMSKFVDVALLSLHPISVTGSSSSCSIYLSLSTTTSTPLQSLWALMTFLNSQFFPYLPPAQVSFPVTMHTPILSAVLVHLLQASIPPSLATLPPFLDTADEAVRFEDTILSESNRDRSIRNWVNDVAGHYERKRREYFLRQVKDVSIGPDVQDQEELPREETLESSPKEEEDTFDGWGWEEDEEATDKASLPQNDKETYSISPRARKVMQIVHDVIREGQELTNSHVFDKVSTKATVPGQLLIAAVPVMLDLHRALYPIAHSDLLLRDPNLAVRWSNDCKFLSAELAKLCQRHGPASTERWFETAERLMTLGELCYENAVECPEPIQ